MGAKPKNENSAGKCRIYGEELAKGVDEANVAWPGVMTRHAGVRAPRVAAKAQLGNLCARWVERIGNLAEQSQNMKKVSESVGKCRIVGEQVANKLAGMAPWCGEGRLGNLYYYRTNSSCAATIFVGRPRRHVSGGKNRRKAPRRLSSLRAVAAKAQLGNLYAGWVERIGNLAEQSQKMKKVSESVGKCRISGDGLRPFLRQRPNMTPTV